MGDVTARFTVRDSAGNSTFKDVTVKEQTSRFPGDPGPGVVMSGCTVVTEGSAPDGMTWLDEHTTGNKKHRVARLYGKTVSGETNATMDWARIDICFTLGRIPAASCKYTQWTPEQIVQGLADVRLTAEVAAVKARAPKIIWLSYFHEPFDDFKAPTRSAAYRAAFRYIVMFFRTRGVTNVVWFGPSTMVDWEYRDDATVINARGGLAYHSDPDWKGTKSGPGGTVVAADWYTGTDAVIDILSFDQYSPLIGSQTYESFVKQFNLYIGKQTLWQRPMKPLFIPEIGTQNASTTVNWTTHWSQFLTLCIQYNIVAYCYFNYANGNGSSFITEDAGGVRLAGYNAMFQDARVLGIPA